MRTLQTSTWPQDLPSLVSTANMHLGTLDGVGIIDYERMNATWSFTRLELHTSDCVLNYTAAAAFWGLIDNSTTIVC